MLRKREPSPGSLVETSSDLGEQGRGRDCTSNKFPNDRCCDSRPPLEPLREGSSGALQGECRKMGEGARDSLTVWAYRPCFYLLSEHHCLGASALALEEREGSWAGPPSPTELPEPNHRPRSPIWMRHHAQSLPRWVSQTGAEPPCLLLPAFPRSPRRLPLPSRASCLLTGTALPWLPP